MNVVVYGISNCDTVKKAIKWLEANGINTILYDYRKDGLTTQLLQTFNQQLSWEDIVNKRSTTWRSLTAQEQQTKDNAWIELLLANPTLIKRPIIILDNQTLVGFNENIYKQAFIK